MSDSNAKEIYVDGSYSHWLRIPPEWEFAELRSVIDLVGGSQPPKSSFKYEDGPGLIRLIQIRDYKSDDKKVFIEKSTARRFVSKSDIMIGRYGPPIFQILRGLEGAYNVALMKAVPIEGSFTKDYLFHYLRNKDIYNYVDSASDRTAGQSGVNKEHLEKYPVPVPPLAEQKQIAAKLDELLAQVDTIKTRLDAIPHILKRFRQSVLAAAISGKLTEEWRQSSHFGIETTVGELASDIKYGTSKKCDSEQGSTPVLRIPNIGEGKVDLEDLKFADFDEKELSSLKLKVGDILVIRSNGSVDLVGKAALIDQTAAHCLYAGYLIRLRFDVKQTNPKYMLYCIQSPQIRKVIEIQARSTSGVNNINTKELSALPVTIPVLEEQTEIVRRVEKLFAYADQIEQRVKDAQARVNHLTQSILAKAFRGELTADWRAQNPDLISGDNSAAALLARIRTEREAAASKPKTRKKRA